MKDSLQNIHMYDCNNTVNSQVYVTELLQPFIAQLTEEKLEYAFFQQNGATAHTSRFSITYVYEAFGEERTGLWPPRSPDLSTCDYLWGILKDKVYSNNRHTIEYLKKAFAMRLRKLLQMNWRKLPETC